MPNKKGMTLLEVLISLVLFAVISISLMRMTDTTIQYRKKITKNIKNIKLSRNALQIIKKDIRNIFYTQDMNAFAHLLTPQNEEGLFADFEKTMITPYLFNKIHISGGIIGKPNSLHIASFSNVRTQENAKFSDQNIIIYYLKPCKSREQSKENSTCLWRKFSFIINQDMDNLKNYNEFVLLEKVKKFQLSYYNISSNDWLQEWKTGPNERNFLPAAIHIKIEFENKRKQLVKREIKLPLHHSLILPVQGTK